MKNNETIEDSINKDAAQGKLLTRDHIDAVLHDDLKRVSGLVAMILQEKSVRAAVVEVLYTKYLTKVEGNVDKEVLDQLKEVDNG